MNSKQKFYSKFHEHKFVLNDEYHDYYIVHLLTDRYVSYNNKTFKWEFSSHRFGLISNDHIISYEEMLKKFSKEELKNGQQLLLSKTK